MKLHLVFVQPGYSYYSEDKDAVILALIEEMINFCNRLPR